MPLRPVSIPTEKPITLDQAKAHLRVEHNNDDALISALIAAALAHIEGPAGVLGRFVLQQTWELVLDTFPANEIMIPCPPLQSVAAVRYFDANGDLQTLAAAEYVVDNVSEPGWVLPASAWPATLDSINTVAIEFTAGYPAQGGDYGANVPASLKQAMLLFIGAWYENREDAIAGTITAALPDNVAAKALLSTYWMPRV